MTTYLTIITTLLVLTQIVRLIQNAMQLANIERRNSHIEKVYGKLEYWLDKQEERED